MDKIEARVSRTGRGQNHLNTLVPLIIRVRLFDPFLQPMPDAPYRLTLGDLTFEGRADKDAWVEVHVREVPEWGTIQWRPLFPKPFVEAVQGPGYPADTESADGEPGNHGADPQESPGGLVSEALDEQDSSESEAFAYEQEIYLRPAREEESVAASQRLHNLGFYMRKSAADNVRAFQLTYNHPLTGNLEDIKCSLQPWHDDCEPNPFPQLKPKDEIS